MLTVGRGTKYAPQGIIVRAYDELSRSPIFYRTVDARNYTSPVNKLSKANGSDIRVLPEEYLATLSEIITKPPNQKPKVSDGDLVYVKKFPLAYTKLFSGSGISPQPGWWYSGTGAWMQNNRGLFEFAGMAGQPVLGELRDNAIGWLQETSNNIFDSYYAGGPGGC